MASLDKLHGWLLRTGLAISAVLLIRLAIDFGRRMSWRLAGPLWLLVIVTLLVGSISVLGARAVDAAVTIDPRPGKLLLATIPVGFFASSLGCAGLSLDGCSPFCTFVKLEWAPLIGAACIACCLSNRRGWLTAILVMSFVPLVPHCVCRNVGNAWWIDRVGASPLCYAWGFAVALIATGTMLRAKGYWWSLAVSFLIIAGAFTFFISHHFYHFPW